MPMLDGELKSWIDLMILKNASDLILTEFMQTLGEGLFTQVRLVSTRRLESVSPTEEFQIECLLK